MTFYYVIKGTDGYVGAFPCGTWRDKHVCLAMAYRFGSLDEAVHILRLFGGMREIVQVPA